MPKRGKGQRSWRNNKNFDEFKDYYEHDDRSGDNTRRVSFKGGNRISKHGRQKDADPAIRVRLLEDDIDMVGGVSQSTSRGRFGPTFGGGSRGSRMKRGRGGRISQHSPHGGRQKLVDQTGWFRIFLPWGGKHDKQYLLGVLKSHIAPIEMVPIAYRIENQDAAFFIDDLKVAEALQDADRKIAINGGFKMNVRVTPGMPRIDMNDALKERIKLAMVKRFNTATKALDLTRFHLDPDLVGDSFCAVARPQVLTVIMDIVAEHIPELVALNLDQNNIYVPDALGIIARKAANLKILYLGDNRIRDLNTLLAILKPLQLLELKIEGNPLCKKFDSKSELTSAVRKTLTKLIKLDGVELPPVIGFDVEDDARTRLPVWQGSFLCSDAGRDIAKQFVEQYFALYDAAEGCTRQPLLEAYHEMGVFTLTSAYPPGQSQPAGPKLNTYISDSRNLLRINDSDRRNKMMRVGKLGIVSFLSELPRTQHDPSSFTLDLTVVSQHLITLSLTGLFREPGVKHTPMRYFLRKFVLVPVGTGFCIVNEMLFVTNATPTQAKRAFSTPAVPAPQPVAAVVASPGHSGLPAGMTELQVVEALAAQTNMNVIWSRKCLEETRWDPHRALAAFQELNSQGRVPPEAFLK